MVSDMEIAVHSSSFSASSQTPSEDKEDSWRNTKRLVTTFASCGEKEHVCVQTASEFEKDCVTKIT